MKNLFRLLTTFAFLALLVGKLNAQFGGGLGTETNPYQIWTKSHLQELNDSVRNSPLNNSANNYNWSRNKHFKLMDNITDSVRTIIGSYSSYDDFTSFQGHFDGNGKKITLAIYDTLNCHTGLFSSITEYAVINNLTVDGYVIQKLNRNPHTYVNVGGIVGMAYKSTISNCTNFAIVTGHFDYGGGRVGGIIGHIYAAFTTTIDTTLVINCVNNGNIYAYNYDDYGATGGIVGVQDSYSKLLNCINNGNVYVECNDFYTVGGITGSADIIQNCINNGNIEMKSNNPSSEHLPIGGITGNVAYQFTIIGSTNNGIVSSECSFVGGIVGNIQNPYIINTISNCINSGVVVGKDYIGGIVGGYYNEMNINIISNCINIGSIMGENYVGGIAGRPYGISSCFNSGFVKGKNRVGGITGIIGSSYGISRCFNSGVVSGDTQTGGIVGVNYGTIIGCYYDKQMCIYGGIDNSDIAGQAEGFLTKDLIGNNLLAKLGTTNWTYNNNIYPTLKSLENETISKVATAPAFLCSDDIDDYDKHNNIRHNFQVSTNNSVVWQSALGYVNILGSDVDVVNFGNDTLIAVIDGYIGRYKKIIPVILNDNKTCGTIPPIELDSFNLTLTTNPDNAGTVTGSGKYETGQKVEIEAIANDCYKFLNWSANGTFISSENPLLVTISSDTLLVANFEYICDTIDTINAKFYIRVSTHKLLDPRWKNYPIPIYIKADENISNAIIEKLVINVDRNLFYPQRVDNGTMTLNFIDTLIETTFENVLVPELKANEEELLLTIWGAVLLGNKDSNDIFIKPPVKFSKELSKEPELFDGHITLYICRAGGDRLVRWLEEHAPAILVKNNPVDSKVLEVECRTIEIGNYRLEVIDLLGHTKIIKDWEVTEDTTDLIFNFDIPIDNFNFTSGNYLLVMNTPTSRYITKFVVQK